MFIGREKELQLLQPYVFAKRPSLLVIKGRRRIGKSTLIRHFAKLHNIAIYEFQGLPPRDGLTKEAQLNHFAKTLNNYFKLGTVTFTDWMEAFNNLHMQTKSKNCLIFLDEISWMAIGDHDFPGKLKVAWDTLFSQQKKLIVAVAGSVSSWIEKNISKNTGYVGRISIDLQLKELPIDLARKFMDSEKFTSQEMIQLLSVTGGIPKYLEEISSKEEMSTNIIRLCFQPSGFLFQEFDLIFSETFGRRHELYKKILLTLVDRPRSTADIAKTLKMPLNGDISIYIDDLILAGFLRRDHTWSMSGKISNLSELRICDNYCRFYLKQILSRKKRIEKHPLKLNSSLSFLNWDTIIGLQFENLVLNNYEKVINALNISDEDIIQLGPFFQRKNTNQKGVQIDLMIQTRQQILWVGEIKCRKRITPEIIEEMKQKIKNMRKPRGFAIRPFLIYFGELSNSVLDSDYYAKCIKL